MLSELASETELASLLVWSVFISEEEPWSAELDAEETTLVASELSEADTLLATLLNAATLDALELTATAELAAAAELTLALELLTLDGVQVLTAELLTPLETTAELAATELDEATELVAELVLALELAVELATLLELTEEVALLTATELALLAVLVVALAA